MASKHLTPDQQNFTRLVIVCVDLIKLVLKDILKIKIKPADLYNEISSCAAFTSGSQKLRPEQQRICYIAAPDVPDYDNFDVSLLYTLIRNLCPSLKPTLGWGKTPSHTALQIGDDIERLRTFRNEFHGHCGSSNVIDKDFISRWNNIETVIKRMEIFISSQGFSSSYEKELERIKHLDLCSEDMAHYRILLEGMMCLLKKSENEGIPNILIHGENRVTYGEVACIKVIENSIMDMPLCVTWQRVRGGITEQININTEKYKGSNDRQLMIHKVSTEDEWGYQVFISGQGLKLTSNSVSLMAVGDLPKLHTLNVSTGEKEIILHYEYTVSDISPKVHHISWAKNGQNLSIDHVKYDGGGIDDKCLTITSPTAEDAGRYTCTVINAVGPVSKSMALDIPSATISNEVPVYVGSRTNIRSKVEACPPPEKIIWQKSSDSVTFETITMDDPRYFGSKQNSSNPVLTITKTAFGDKLYYRLVVWNKIGECVSNTLHLNVTGSPPNISNSQVTNIQNRSVTLTCEIFLYENSPAVLEVCWMKNNCVLDIAGSGGKLAGGNITNPSLVINNVNKFDAGSYQCKASNAVGSTLGNVIVLDIPDIDINENSTNDSKVFKADLRCIPTPTQVEWNAKDEDSDEWTEIDVTRKEYRGSTNSLPQPVLVVNREEFIKISNFQIKVKNFIGTKTKILSDAGIPHLDTIEDCRANTFDARNQGCTDRFNKLLLRIAKEVPEKEQDILRGSLEDSFDEIERLVERGKENRDIPSEDTTSMSTDDDEENMEDYARDYEFQKRFQQYLEEGSVDVCPISQIIIVGENGVGKTTLLYRLQGRTQEEINQIKSTRGMECHTQKSGFIVTNGILKMNKDGKSNLTIPPERILAGITKEQIKEEDAKEENVIEEDKEGSTIIKKETAEVKILEGDEREIETDGDLKEIHPSEMNKSADSNEQPTTHKNAKINAQSIITEAADVSEGRGSKHKCPMIVIETDGDVEKIYPSATEMNKSTTSDEQPTTDENAKINARFKITEAAEVSEGHGKNLATRATSAVKRRLAEEHNITMKLRSRNDVVLNSFDFAGQGAYYASHQTYMRKGAIYIIVFDASRSLSTGRMFNISADGKANQDPIASDDDTCLCDRPNTSFSCWSQSDYIHYWLNTIRVHGGGCDYIILVGTHKDKITN